MKESKKDLSKKTSKIKYKASNPQQFKEWFNSNKPYYKELCKGEAVEVDLKNKTVKSWIDNKIIIKEN